MELEKVKFKDSVLGLQKVDQFHIFTLDNDSHIYSFEGLEAEIIKGIFDFKSGSKSLESISLKHNYDPEELKNFTIELVEMLEPFKLFV